MKRFLAMILAAALAMGLAGCGGKGGAGTTPEATVETFLDALKKQDLDTMLKCCYIEDYCDAFSFQETIARQRFMEFTHAEAPTEYGFYKETMLLGRRALMANRIRILASSLAMQTGDAGAWEAYKEKYITAAQIAFPPKENDRIEETVADFIKAVDPAGLRGLEITGIERFQPEDEDQKAYFERQAENLGATQAAEIDVTMELDGAKFQKGFMLVEAEGRWQISWMCGPYLGDDGSLGAARRIN